LARCCDISFQLGEIQLRSFRIGRLRACGNGAAPSWPNAVLTLRIGHTTLFLLPNAHDKLRKIDPLATYASLPTKVGFLRA
jgi:hypothetical protein